MLTHAVTVTHTDSSRPHTETHTNSCRMFSVTHMQHILFISTIVTQTRQLIQTLKHTNRLQKSQRNLQILPLSGRTKQNVLAWKMPTFLFWNMIKQIQMNCKIDFIDLRSLLNLRFHIEDIPHSHLSLPMAVSLTNQLLFSPGHMDTVRSWRGLVVQNGMWLSVPVMNQLSLKEQDTRFTTTNSINVHWKCCWIADC